MEQQQIRVADREVIATQRAGEAAIGRPDGDTIRDQRIEAMDRLGIPGGRNHDQGALRDQQHQILEQLWKRSRRRPNGPCGSGASIRGVVLTRRKIQDVIPT